MAPNVPGLPIEWALQLIVPGCLRLGSLTPDFVTMLNRGVPAGFRWGARRTDADALSRIDAVVTAWAESTGRDGLVRPGHVRAPYGATAWHVDDGGHTAHLLVAIVQMGAQRVSGTSVWGPPALTLSANTLYLLDGHLLHAAPNDYDRRRFLLRWWLHTPAAFAAMRHRVPALSFYWQPVVYDYKKELVRVSKTTARLGGW